MFETSNKQFINPNRWEEDQLVICKHHRRHSSLMLRVGLEPMTSSPVLYKPLGLAASYTSKRQIKTI